MENYEALKRIAQDPRDSEEANIVDLSLRFRLSDYCSDGTSELIAEAIERARYLASIKFMKSMGETK